LAAIASSSDPAFMSLAPEISGQILPSHG